MTTQIQENQIQPERLAQRQSGSERPALRAMLEARSVALVGASSRAGSFGARMGAEVGRSPAAPELYLVNPRYPQIGGRRCYPSLADLPGPVDLVLLGVPDLAREDQLALAASRGDRSAVIFGNAYETPTTAATQPDAENPSDPLVAGAPPDAGSTSGLRLAESRLGAQTPPGQATRPGPLVGGAPPDPGSTSGLRQRLALLAESAGMELCGAGCMGFANVGYGVRAMGYVEPDPLPTGPVALVTHSGSVFSALLRTRRAFGFTLAVSSGQELFTTAGSYLQYALEQPETKVLALVLEAIRQPARLREALRLAAERDLPVVMLTAGTSAAGQAMVTAHSGALAAADGGWEALARAYGVHRVADLAELADTLELFALRARPTRSTSHSYPTGSASPTDPHNPDPAARTSDSPTGLARSELLGAHDHGNLVRSEQHLISVITENGHRRGADLAAPGGGRRRGIATVHDSGLERAHAVDVADQLGVPFAEISDATRTRLAELLDPGLIPGNPLDVWGTGAQTRQLFADSLAILAQDDAVAAVALAVDLITELDGDNAYQLAVLDAASRTDKPVAVLSNLPAGIDPDAAGLLRGAGVPVLEGLRTGLLALRHLLDQQAAADRRSLPASDPHPSDRTEPANQGKPPPAEPATPAGPVGRAGSNLARRARALELLAAGEHSGEPQLALLREYGIATARSQRVTGPAQALAAAAEIGYPVVLKTDQPGISHKSDARGVILGIADPDRLADAYADLAARLGPAALV